MACVHRKNRSILVPFFRQEPPGRLAAQEAYRRLCQDATFCVFLILPTVCQSCKLLGELT